MPDTVRESHSPRENQLWSEVQIAQTHFEAARGEFWRVLEDGQSGDRSVFLSASDNLNDSRAHLLSALQRFTAHLYDRTTIGANPDSSI